jgi:hypothetical protein
VNARPPVRQAGAADLPVVREIVAAAYDKYLVRMDRPPAPMLRDYAPAVEAGTLWVTGQPVAGLISLIPEDDSVSDRLSDPQLTLGLTGSVPILAGWRGR